MKTNPENLSLSDIALVNECQTKADIYKGAHNTVWQGINMYYFQLAQKQNMSAEDLKILKDSFQKLVNIMETITPADSELKMGDKV